MRYTFPHGHQSRIGNEGNFFEPTVLTDVPENARIMREEPFGPVAVMLRFNDTDDVLARANSLPFGLASYTFTKDAKTATKVADALDHGMVSINHFGIALPETPFGGVKDSGYGHEGGIEGLNAYLQTKFVSTSANPRTADGERHIDRQRESNRQSADESVVDHIQHSKRLYLEVRGSLRFRWRARRGSMMSK